MTIKSLPSGCDDLRIVQVAPPLTLHDAPDFASELVLEADQPKLIVILIDLRIFIGDTIAVLYIVASQMRLIRSGIRIHWVLRDSDLPKVHVKHMDTYDGIGRCFTSVDDARAAFDDQSRAQAS